MHDRSWKAPAWAVCAPSAIASTQATPGNACRVPGFIERARFLPGSAPVTRRPRTPIPRPLRGRRVYALGDPRDSFELRKMPGKFDPGLRTAPLRQPRIAVGQASHHVWQVQAVSVPARHGGLDLDREARSAVAAFQRVPIAPRRSSTRDLPAVRPPED